VPINSTYRRLRRVLALLPLMLLGGCSLAHFPLLDPHGPIGQSEFELIVTAFLIMLIPVVPVMVMTFWFAWRYRATRAEAAPAPSRAERTIEWVVWTVPAAIVIALGVLTWATTHRLDPYKSIAAPVKPIRIEAIALDWKWLFIYPDAHVATVNQLVIPTNVPVSFRITSDTVMTSFFIPRLGSQIYAMAGMQTRLHLLADKPGRYTGMNSQFSGAGFPEMHFRVAATSEAAYQRWLRQVRQRGATLDMRRFDRLAQPSAHNPVVQFASVQPGLFDAVIQRYRPATGAVPGMER
jgi:cytochrome o ubiquinol oxidase subunit 2